MSASLLLCILNSGFAQAETDTIGAAGSYGYQYGMMKLVEVDVTESAVVTQLEFALSNYGWGDEVTLVAYVRDGDHFALMASAEASFADGDVVWAQSGELSLLFEAGGTYAIGAYVGDGVLYFYDDNEPGDLWFGDTTGSYQVEGGVSDSIEPDEREGHYYYMQVTSSPADADGDGGVAVEFGGNDCDDSDPSVNAGAEETPYDGIDQDCDGFDLTDVDGDGEDAVEAGGSDCDDEDPSIGTGLPETCDDGIDQDCDGSDLSCDEANQIPSVDASADCGCGTGASMGGAALALGLAGVLSRRRR
jgi:hypothetical protein